MNDGVLRLHLPELQRSSIWRTYLASGTLRIDADSFRVSSKLQALSLDHCGTVSLTPDSLTRLTALATFKLDTCGLVRVPAAVTALAGSLTSLALPYNDGLQLTDDGCTRLLTLKKLKNLDLQKSCVDMALHIAGLTAPNAVLQHLDNNANPWSPQSLQHLVELPGAFLAQNGRLLALTMYKEDSSDEDSSEGEEDDV